MAQDQEPTMPATKKKTAKKKAAKKAAKAPDANKLPKGVRLFVVQEGCSIFWPLAGMPLRGRQGTIVRSDDPFVEVRGYPVQKHRTRPVTDAEIKSGKIVLENPKPRQLDDRGPHEYPVKVTPCNNRRMLKEYHERGLDWMTLEIEQVEAVSTIEPRQSESFADADFSESDLEVPGVDGEDVLAASENLPEDKEAEAIERAKKARGGFDPLVPDANATTIESDDE